MGSVCILSCRWCVFVSDAKRHSLQAVELSQRIQTVVQIVSKPPDPSHVAPIYGFWASRPCGPAGWLALLLIKQGDVETNPGPTTSHKRVWICHICYKQIHVLNTGCTSDAQVFAKNNTQIPGSAIYTENPDPHITPT